ncbi:ParB/RepB/Spo0J family partition protein [Taibaiella soli]|uniref:ParB-like N-terminal domain-containing protein n=1 Tax=Taibaiella soli TaxID=1649169 RepID=A0A2W2BGI0_9BACT|nr:ParB/RepB/Spo0J family partition protein [Taibaiella soli]PZF72596.1 hypothetical protein DN068_12075 [Taibaiella soli]
MSEKEKNSLINSIKPHPFRFLELPLDAIEGDLNQPRKAFGLRAGGDHNRLLKSISTYGIEDPIKVCEIEEGRYRIMDGHRRFACAKELKFKKVPCRIYPKMKDGEFEARRYEMQNNRREWKPIEKANAIHRIRTEYNNASEKEVADLIGMRQTTLFHFTALRNMRMEYLELMSEHNLKEYQRISLMQLLPKLRKIKRFEVDDIVKILFKKINDNLLYKRSDFISLAKVFSIASLNEEELLKFLTEPQISVDELCEMTQLSGFSFQIRSLIKDLSVKRNLNIELTKKEQNLVEDLYKLIENFM